MPTQLEFSVLVVLYETTRHNPVTWIDQDDLVGYVAEETGWTKRTSLKIIHDYKRLLGERELIEIRRTGLFGRSKVRITQAGVNAVSDKLSR